MIQLDFEGEKEKYHDMLDTWERLKRIKMNPGALSPEELHKHNENYSAKEWKEFLTDPQIMEMLNTDFVLAQKAKLWALVNDLGPDTKSTGIAQLITTLNNNLNKEIDKKQDGPAIIYTFVPLNKQEQQSPNVRMLKHNPFEVKE